MKPLSHFSTLLAISFFCFGFTHHLHAQKNTPEVITDLSFTFHDYSVGPSLGVEYRWNPFAEHHYLGVRAETYLGSAFGITDIPDTYQASYLTLAFNYTYTTPTFFKRLTVDFTGGMYSGFTSTVKPRYTYGGELNVVLNIALSERFSIRLNPAVILFPNEFRYNIRDQEYYMGITLPLSVKVKL